MIFSLICKRGVAGGKGLLSVHSHKVVLLSTVHLEGLMLALTTPMCLQAWWHVPLIGATDKV